MPGFKRLARVLFIGGVIAALSVVGIWAQSARGTITGTVSDASGAVIPGVEVTATNVGTGIARTAVTTDTGLYRVTNLSPGRYTVKASLTGFKTAISEAATLSVDQILHVDLKLEVGEVSEQVTVTEAVKAVEVEQGRVSSLVSAEQIKDLPLNGRNIYQLMQTAPGVTNSRATVFEPGQNSSVNGGRANFNGFWLDGVTSKNLSGGVDFSPNVDSVQEFRIETLNFSAEYGNSSGSITSVVTKSGTNNFHGTVYDFLRNDALDAREFFDRKKPSFKRNQYGFSIGGPIQKNQTFFFGSYEGNKIRTGKSTIGTFESAEWANFVQKFVPKNVSAFLYKNYPGRPITTVTSTMGSNLTDLGYIKSNTQANVDAFLASTFGAPAGSLKATDPMVGETSFFTPQTTDANQWSVRIDHEFSEKDKLYGRYYYDDSNSPVVQPRPAFNSPVHSRAHHLTLNETHIFSPSVVNEARGGLSRGIGDIFAGTPGVPLVAESGSTTAQFGAYNGYPQLFHENVFDYSDVLSVTKGRHGIKIGAEFRRNQENSEFNVGRPSYSFFDLIYLALDQPYYQVGGVDPHIVDGTHKAELSSNFRGWRNSEIGLFFNDDFKLSPRLTLNLGVRWDFYSRLTEVNGRATKYDLSAGGGNIFKGVALGGFTTTDKLSANDWNNFAPRLGLAWDLFGNGKTSLRAGYGIAYQSGVYNPLANSRWNPPYYSFNLICIVDACGRPNENVLYGPQTGEPVRATGPDTNVGGRLFEGNIIAYDPNNNNTTFLTGIPNPNMRDPYIMSYFFGIQREILRNLTIEANYVGTGGRKIIRAENFNRFDGDRLGAPDPVLGRFAGDKSLNRINPKLGTLRFWENSVSSNYNALQVQVRRRFSGGFGVTGNYTFAKSLDSRSTWHSGATTSNGAQEGYSTDVVNQYLDYGRSVFDARHRISGNFTWELPWLRKASNAFVRQVFGGWQINAIVALQSGQPFTPFCSVSRASGCDWNADGTNNDRPNTPSLGNHFSSVPSRQSWVNPNSGPFNIPGTSRADKLNFFGVPALGSDGNLGRNTFEGPNFKNVDFALFKNFGLSRTREDLKLQFRSEFFNLFNRVNFFQPTVQINAGTFGRPTATFDARQIQFAFKVIF